MNTRVLPAAGAMLLTPLGAVAVDTFTSLHPEEAIPDNTGRTSPDRYTDLNMQNPPEK